MVTAIILAGGTGSRMRTSGMPKQFLSVYGKPIICYTLEVFENCSEVDQIIVPCNSEWVKHMNSLIKKFGFSKVKNVIPGGKDRHGSIQAGIEAIGKWSEDDLVLIHDGVRPLIKESTILENITTARTYGNAMTVKQNIETVVVTNDDAANYEDFKNRNHTYTLTAPQTFKIGVLVDIYKQLENREEGSVPLLDPSLMLSYLGKKVYLVKETGLNLKVTTPEDFYYLRSYLELNENKNVLGL